jgi:acetoin utilization deacetylase AcuC-like enzyme
MPPTGFVTHAAFLAHDTGAAHAERRARLEVLEPHLASEGLLEDLERADPREATPEQLRAVHDADYVAAAERRIAAGEQVLDAGDTVVSPASWRAALLAAGGATLAVDEVQCGHWSNAFLAARPPGHHAERSHAMGFCIFNNVAVAAAHLLNQHGLERVAILDWDVHHGNGTQHTFERDPRVFFASLHQWPHYPGTGAASERGYGEGEGATLNVPMDAGDGDREYLEVFERKVLPALEDFAPQFVLISAGFDAHERDPLSSTRVTEEGYRQMTAGIADLARRHCGGKLVSLLEGGYDLDALKRSVGVHLAGLLEA